jgi:hypothetical protein
MNAAWRWIAKLCALACLVGSARAGVQCGELFMEKGEPDLYYALVFVEPASKQERDRLRSQVDPKLADIERELYKRVPAKRRIQLKLLACEYQLGSDDLAPKEMKKFVDSNVIAVFWKTQEGDKPGLVQLAMPIYTSRSSVLRHDVEVVWQYPAQAANAIDAWIEALGQDNAIYRPFVAMGLATIYGAEEDWRPALVALCDSRVRLSTLATSSLRPARDAFETSIATPMGDLMKAVEHKARAAGLAEPPPCSVPATAVAVAAQ